MKNAKHPEKNNYNFKMFPKIFAVVAVLNTEVVPVFVSLVAAGHGAHQDLGLVVAAHVGAEVLLGGEGAAALLAAELPLGAAVHSVLDESLAVAVCRPFFLHFALDDLS